mmetsp:Transcript_7744/g.13486  ORF Transcript_7744/g.13486 Transcript_7744/m.13486 type:complete len:1395 (-) Transcript_7744:164-4348(-)
MSGGAKNQATFPIPSSLQELESAPYNLLPYPQDFDDDDEAARAESFSKLIRLLEGGNRTLLNSGLGLFEVEDEDEEDFDAWNGNERIQALYTLVRKSDSLAPATRGKLVKVLCNAVHGLCEALESSSSAGAGMVMQSQTQTGESQEGSPASGSYVVSQAFRDALACHIYMLFTVMFLTESKEKLGKSLGTTATTSSGRSKKGGKSKKNQNSDKGEDLAASRAMCAEAMYNAAITMSSQKSKLWKRSVPDEAVVGLPCRIAYQILEAATGVHARKASSGDKALQMIAATVDSAPCLLNTVVSALVDLLHTYDHMAPLCAELCTIVKESPSNILATELLREIGRLDTDGYSDSSAAGNKASGIKNVAPFISELAAVRPRVVLSNISLLLPHLDSEPYVLRSAIINSIGHILVREDHSLVERKEDKDGDSGDESEEESNTIKEQRQMVRLAKTRNSLFDILCDRTHDITSFTRAASLKVLNDLTEKQSLPLDRIMPVTAIAIDRLQDKTVMVRRYAMQLVTSLLENNPFMGMLNPDLYREKIRELEAYLKDNVPEEILKARDAALEEAKQNDDDESGNGVEGEDDGNAEKERQEIESAALAAAIADAESKHESNEDLSEAESEFLARIRGLKFASSALSFIEVFENANDSFQTMLMSSNPSDVTEALRFFVKAKHFGLPCAVTGMKRALALMWSNETNIQDEVLRAFVEVFVAEPGTEGKELLPENQIAQNFLDLAGEATVSELASIEEALGRLVKKEIIPPDVFSILWTMASQAEGQLRASAMLVISMAAGADPKIVDSAYRLQNLYDAGLGDYTEEHSDWKTARSAACALQRVARAKVDPSSAKYIILDLITERLVAVARGDWCDDTNEEDTNSWFCAAEQAINAIFTISPAPEKVSMEILLGHQAGIFGSQEEAPSSGTAHSLRLSRFFFVLGHIALKLLIYTEVLSSSVRRANSAKSVKKQESASSGKKNMDSDAESKEGSDEEEDDAIEAELGIAAQAEAETELQAAEISEHEIVGRGMISLFTPMLLRVVANEEGTYSSPVLMQSATLALCKCMCISKSFCEKHLTLLFSVLAKAPNDDQDLRANIVIAVGDLAFRFPNEVEPYTPRIYACLKDKSTRVRRHTLMVLTHLILNDMVKVKGNVCEIALCLQDQEPRIRDMARLLFHELSKRTNSPIYNLIPDIVSQLSQLNLKQEVFRHIMLFLLSFIKKDKQNEMLMEKLIQRFPNCTSINQKADLAYCIAQLKVNDKCIKCLNDTFKLYKDALFDEDVLKNFMSVMSKAKKNTKLDTKDALEELEAKLNEHAAAGMENVKASKKAARAKTRAAKRTARKKEWEESDEEEEKLSEAESERGELEFDEENQPENRKAPLAVADKAAKRSSGRSNRSRRGVRS